MLILNKYKTKQNKKLTLHLHLIKKDAQMHAHLSLLGLLQKDKHSLGYEHVFKTPNLYEN